LKRLACAALCFIALSANAASKTAAKPITLQPSDIKYVPAPPSMPPGAQIAVLVGDPGKKGPFVVRFKMPDGYVIAPHWHSQDEQLTVLAGVFALGLGDKTDPAAATSLEAGAFHFLPGKTHHYAITKGETVLEIHGVGPFDAHYVNAADDPSKVKAEAK
jgi:quercetin dioxygenase-like cupin family protein